MRALIIGPAQKAQIAALKKRAAADVIDIAEAMQAPPDAVRAYNRAATIDIPQGYAVTYTHELQPEAGLCCHLSVSVDRKGRAPTPEAVDMIAAEFGMRPSFNKLPRIPSDTRVWTEDFEAGRVAVNVVQTMEPK